jgi:hypothetical protein
MYSSIGDLTRERFTMASIHRRRPGAADLAVATGTDATAIGEGVWMSEGVSNAYAVVTDASRVVINTGLVFEAPMREQAFSRLGKEGLSRRPPNRRYGASRPAGHASFRATVERMQAWLTEHPQTRFGLNVYSLDQYGLSMEQLKPVFAECLGEFDIELKGVDGQEPR